MGEDLLSKARVGYYIALHNRAKVETINHV